MSLASVMAVTPHPKGFRSRRALNWISLGLLYASFYMCRYNFRFAVPGIMHEFHFTTSQITDIMAIWSLAYGTGQLFNGLLADRIGGKLSLLIGGVGTIIVNLVFGCTSLASNFATFTLIWLINGIVQAEGPGMVKINTAWFDRRERGTFSGIYGLVIQSGQVAISHIAPIILAGFTIFAFTVPPGEWRWLFRIPPIFTAVTAILMALCVKQTPDEAGFPGAIHDEIDDSAGVTVPLLQSLKTILTHPLVWFYAVAYGCTGAVRSSSDQIAILYFQDQLGFDMKTNIPAAARITLEVMPVVAVLGSFLSGWVSDHIFKGHRSPVAMALYLIEAIVISIAAFVLLLGKVGPTPSGIFVGCLILILISFTANSTHSIVGTAAPMDIGGKKMAGFAAGVIDSFQYYGAAISLSLSGRVLEATKGQFGYTFWFVIMAAFGLLGACAMAYVRNTQRAHGQAPAPDLPV
ncbi:MAG: MFS transporter [Verrucomicrobia bacterium]|jgi:OPA family glycerol-3-phosphate transporter-like MFS transporter|nr:MFS transporter [Verrucomicrobiota bacterium]NBS83888.1 MFS transporter [Verrucomicrobiota bacterium]